MRQSWIDLEKLQSEHCDQYQTLTMLKNSSWLFYIQRCYVTRFSCTINCITKYCLSLLILSLETIIN